MGVPLAASTRQATTRAADVDSVRLACAMAFHTKILLQEFQLVQPMSFRLLTGGPLAMQLGLSKKERHIDLWHWLGQFQLSKVPPHQNLAESLTYNLSASGLHRLLPQLKMHTRPAEMLALPTVLAGEVAFLRSSSSSFFIGMLRKAPAMAQLTAKELAAAYCDEKSLQQELEAAYLLGQTKARELQRPALHTELSHLERRALEKAALSLELSTAELERQALTIELAQLQPSSLAGTAAATAAGKLQVARDLRSPESIHYVTLSQTMRRYLALAVHDIYMDLRTVVQNNLARKGPDPAGADELRYENVFPNLTKDSVDLVVKAETSYHPKRPANNGVKGEVGSIVATFIMAVWANLPLSLLPGMGMSAYFAYTIVGFKSQSNPVKQVMSAVAIDDVIFIVMSLLAIRLMIFQIFPAWMMKAPMAGMGMLLAFIGLHSGNGLDIIREHPAVLGALSQVQYQLRNDNQREKELENHFEFQKWLRELENACEYKGKSQLCNFELVKKFVISLPFEIGIAKRRTWTMSLQRTLRMTTLRT